MWRWKLCEFQHRKNISISGINLIVWRGLGLVYCTGLKRVAVHCSVCCSVLRRCGVLQCGAVYCNLLQCAAVSCGVLQHVACVPAFGNRDSAASFRTQRWSTPCHSGCVAACCNIVLPASKVISPRRVNTNLQMCIENNSLLRVTLFSLRPRKSSHLCLSFSFPSK